MPPLFRFLDVPTCKALYPMCLLTKTYWWEGWRREPVTVSIKLTRLFSTHAHMYPLVLRQRCANDIHRLCQSVSLSHTCYLLQLHGHINHRRIMCRGGESQWHITKKTLPNMHLISRCLNRPHRLSQCF